MLLLYNIITVVVLLASLSLTAWVFFNIYQSTVSDKGLTPYTYEALWRLAYLSLVISLIAFVLTFHNGVRQFFIG